MRTTLALAALSLAAVASAQPTVQYVDVPGVPFDAELSDAGLFAVASSTTYRGFAKDAGTWVPVAAHASATPNSNYVSAFFDARGCLSAYEFNRQFWDCTGATYLIDVNDGVERLRHTQSGAAYAQLWAGGVTQTWAFNTGYSSAPASWRTPVSMLGIGTPLSAVRHGTVDYGFWVTQSATTWTAYLSADGGTHNAFTLPFANVREVHAYSKTGDGLGVLFATDTDLRAAELLDGGGALTTPAVVLTGAGAITGVAYAQGTGDEVGTGFGMAVAQGGAAVYSPIPDPALPAQTWVPHGNAGLANRSLERVTCNGAALCVFTTRDAGTQNVVVYENAAAPRMEPFVVDLNEDGAPLTLRADAGDPDGDPIHVTWAAAPSGAAYRVDAGTDPNGLVATITPLPGLVCGTEFGTYPLAVAASDGWAAHTTRDGGVVRIRHTIAPGAPTVAGPTTLAAGGDPITLVATAADGGCPATGGFGWTETTSTGYRLDIGGTGGGTATLHPPDTVCATTTVQYQVVANDGFLVSAPATVAVQVQPFGKPDAAYPPGATATQTSGVHATYAPAATHACAATAGFPGVETTWTFDPASLPGAVVDVGGSPVSSGVVAPQVGLFAPDCQDGTFVLTATNTVVGSGAVSAPATLSIQFTTQLSPIASASVTLTAAPDAGAVVTGSVDSDANCEAQRGLQADVVVIDPSTGQPASSRALVSVPASYALAVAAPCTGGAYAVQAQLVEADGGRGAIQETPVQLPSRPALIAAVESGRLLATCGGGASATISTAFTAETCQTDAVTWQQLSGPALEPIATGSTTMLQTVERGFGALIGSELVLRASTNEGGVPSTHDVALRVDVDPFVRVEHETEVPLAEESGIVGVRVRLTNDTDCDVSGVVVREALNGLRVVPGSVKVNGAAAVEQVEGDALLVPGVALPARGTATMIYSARPALLSRANPVAVALVNGVKVSPEQGLPEVPGRCGCGATSGGTMLAGTLLLLLQRWRRRRPAQSP